MTRFEHFAAAALSGILADHTRWQGERNPEKDVELAITYAEAMGKALREREIAAQKRRRPLRHTLAGP